MRKTRHKFAATKIEIILSLLIRGVKNWTKNRRVAVNVKPVARRAEENRATVLCGASHWLGRPSRKGIPYCVTRTDVALPGKSVEYIHRWGTLVNSLLPALSLSSLSTCPTLDSPFMNTDLDELEAMNGDDEMSGSSSKDKGVSYGRYAAKKTVAQGMMDLALITANANQLRYVIQYQSSSPTYYFVLTLIIISILLQIAVGICLIFKGRFDLKGDEKRIQANAINNYVIVGVFLVTIINVFIAAFSIGPETVPASNKT